MLATNLQSSTRHSEKVTMNSSSDQQTVFLVDDDASIRHALGLLMETIAQPCETFASAQEFLDAVNNDRPGCLVSDIRMPGMSGLELQSKLAERGSSLPVIFITGHGDVPMAVEAMQKGAISFIQKPFRDQELLDCITTAMEQDRTQREASIALSEIETRLDSLTKREREVMELVVAGKPNKIVAYELGVSQRTVEIHRSRVMEKMGAGSLAELVRMNIAYFDNSTATE